MLSKTKGIVLSYTKFKESSIIVKIFTETLGLQSYIVNGIRSAKSKKGMALYQPLTLLDLVVYHKGSGKVNRISEAKCALPFASIPFDIKKSTIAIFITDLLTRVLKEGEENPEEFGYVYHSIAYLDTVKEGFENFHLEFLVGISKFLGFGILSVEEITDEMMTEALDDEIEGMLHYLITKSGDLEVTNELRKKTLSFLIRYFQNQLDHNLDLKSIKILNQVFA